jgi:benzoyl-CoA reductase/2-hydroxyglutaryl-CoA dehydratase subunit BcrC/BadD/HgdB
MSEVLKKLSVLKDQGRSLVGCFPLYPPLPLLHAFGLTPVTLWSLDSEISGLSHSDLHLQNYTCRVGRHLLEFVLGDAAGMFDAFFMYNACDTLRNLPEIIREGLKQERADIPIFRLHVPALSPDRSGARAYLTDKVRGLVHDLEQFTGRTFPRSAFQEAQERYQRQRGLSLEMEEKMRAGEISFAAGAGILRQAHYLPVEEHIGLLEEGLSVLNTARENRPFVPVMVSGILPPPVPLMETMDASGLRVVANDMALFGRSYGYSPGMTRDPETYCCDFYFNHYPCTTMLPEGDRRIELLLGTVRESGARGFIFFGEKFCEYEYFEFPYLENRLRQEGIKTLCLDMGTDEGESLGALKNRIEAFAELLLAGA